MWKLRILSCLVLSGLLIGSFVAIDSFGFQNSWSASHPPRLVITVHVGYQPTNIAFAPFNGYMYVTNYGGGSISVINPVSNKVVLTINDTAAQVTLLINGYFQVYRMWSRS
jgi:YVTN family beta-propeller protein